MEVRALTAAEIALAVLALLAYLNARKAMLGVRLGVSMPFVVTGIALFIRQGQSNHGWFRILLISAIACFIVFAVASFLPRFQSRE